LLFFKEWFHLLLPRSAIFLRGVSSAADDSCNFSTFFSSTATVGNNFFECVYCKNILPNMILKCILYLNFIFTSPLVRVQWEALSK